MRRKPVELLLLVVDQLDVVDKVCLQSTNRFFRDFIHIDRAALNGDRCRKWAITCCFEDDMEKCPAKVACAFCKTVRKKDFYDWKVLKFRNFSTGLLYLGIEEYGRISSNNALERDTIGRYCNAHKKDIFSDHSTLVEESPMRFKPAPTKTPRWVQCEVLRCWYCASCISGEDQRKTGCLKCLCDFYPRYPNKQYYRSGPCVPRGGKYDFDFRDFLRELPNCELVEVRYFAEKGSE